MSDIENSADFVELTVDIVSAYVSNNPVPVGELAQLITKIHASLTQVASGETEAKVAAAPQQPAVPVKKSVTADHIICLEDGRVFKSLKRHLRAKYDMSPEQYRAKWGLPSGLPDGRPELRQGSFGPRQGDRARPDPQRDLRRSSVNRPAGHSRNLAARPFPVPQERGSFAPVSDAEQKPLALGHFSFILP